MVLLVNVCSLFPSVWMVMSWTLCKYFSSTLSNNESLEGPRLPAPPHISFHGLRLSQNHPPLLFSSSDCLLQSNILSWILFSLDVVVQRKLSSVCINKFIYSVFELLFCWANLKEKNNPIQLKFLLAGYKWFNLQIFSMFCRMSSPNRASPVLPAVVGTEHRTRYRVTR